MENMYMIAGVILILIIAYFVFFRKNGSTTTTTTPESDDGPTIYGTMTCPYTVKQTEKYPDYKFVDCSGGNCPSFVTAFPTTRHDDGKIEIGFS